MHIVLKKLEGLNIRTFNYPSVCNYMFLILFSLLSVNCSQRVEEPLDNSNNRNSEQVNSENSYSNQTQNSGETNSGNITCPSCNNTGICPVCGGSGIAAWYDGSAQTCYRCNGTGKCSTCGSSSQQTGNSYNDSGCRSVDQIQDDISKSEELLNSMENDLDRLEANNESVTLQPQYRQMIYEQKQRINELNQELIQAQNR